MSPTGSYTFKWAHSNASDVWVAGTFDDWKKTVQLEKKGDAFEKTVELKSGEKVLYKFVVDGAWVIDPTKPSETDENSIANNVLYPTDIVSAPVVPAISSVGPASSTAKMAGNVPKEDSRSVVPGAFIETPATEPDSFSVKPIPASTGVGNPVTLKPGEKVPDPSQTTPHTVDSTVKLDKESYEQSDSGPAADIVKDIQKSTPVVGGVIIPESSLPVGTSGATPFIQSSGAGSTTASKLADIPLEPVGVPEVVTKSQDKAHVEPEASANPEAVAEKQDVEAELKSKVPEEPAAAESGYSVAKVAGIVSGAAAGAAAAVSAAVIGTKDKVAETAAPAVASAQETAKPVTDKVAAAVGTATGSEPTPSEPHATVPAVVAESIEKSGESAEAAANPVALTEKKEVEAQLKKEVEVVSKAGEPAPTTSASTATKAPEPITAASVPTGDKAPEPAKTEATPDTPKKENLAASAASSPATDKKSKRKSIFGKIKKIFKDKDTPAGASK